MSRYFAPLVLVLVALGCTRKTEPTYVSGPLNIAPPTPPVVIPPDDDSIPMPRLVPVASREESLAAGVASLLAHQSPDDAWRSDVYATFKDGTALTPLVVTALQEAHDAGAKNPQLLAAIKKGCEFLAKFTKPDGTIEPPADGFDYPIYTASLIVKAFSHATANDFMKFRDAWVKYIKERQLTEALGWQPDEKQYGGWGYCRVIPKKPKPNEFAPSLIESNLSATFFALDALKASGETDAKMYEAAAIFVRRWQNWPGAEKNQAPFVWSHFMDGGFHFIYDDPVRNKAGVAHHEPLIFHSYGSTSADGFQALALCGQQGHRLTDARQWLVKNFTARTHPGAYVKAHEPNREAVYYYYAASVARAFRDQKLELPDDRDWSAELSYELATRQKKDGSWANPVEAVRENEPLVATSYAVLALSRCKRK